MTKSLLVFFLLIALWGNAQNQESILHSDSEVVISAIKTDCERKDKGTHIQYFYIKIQNLTEKSISVSFKRNMSYNGKCISCDSSSKEYFFTDTFAPQESKQGDCFHNTERQYRIFSKMLNFESKSILTDFKISNIKIADL